MFKNDVKLEKIMCPQYFYNQICISTTLISEIQIKHSFQECVWDFHLKPSNMYVRLCEFIAKRKRGESF